jgi:hypothetical protein
MRKNLAIACVVTVSGLGFIFGRASTPIKVSSTNSNHAEFAEFNDTSQFETTPPSHASQEKQWDEYKIAEIRKKIDHVKQTSFDKKLAEALGTDTQDKELFRNLDVLYHLDEVQDGERYVENFLASLKADPVAGMLQLKDALEKLPASEFPLERASVLREMAQMKGYSNEANDIALQDLTHFIPDARPQLTAGMSTDQMNAAVSSTPDLLLPIVAQQVFLQTANTPNDALEGTVQGIVAQKDLGIQTTMAVQFLRQYPAQAEVFLASLNSQNITVPKSLELQVTRAVTASYQVPTPGGQQ